MMRVFLAFALTVAVLPLTQPTAAGQAPAVPETTLNIERVVAQYARRFGSKGKVVLDPWTRTPFSPNTRLERVQRDSVSLAALAGIVGVPPAQGLPFTCDTLGRRCRMPERVDAVIAISRPVVMGDRAEVMVAVTERSTSPYQAIHEYEEIIEVVKDGAQWRVVGPTRARAS